MPRRPLRAGGWALLALATPALGLAVFSAAGHDDSHITFWAAHALAEAGDIVNYNGERIEQSSSLLHVLLTAGLVRTTGLGPPTAGYLLGLVGAGLTAVLAYLTARRLEPAAAPLAGAVVAVLPLLAYSAVGGLETAIAAAALLASVLTASVYLDGGRASARWALGGAAACAAAFVLTRPEAGAVLTVALAGFTFAWWLLGRLGRVASGHVRPALRRAGVLLVVGLAVLGAVTGWRLLYFGAPVPNPVGAKVGGLEVVEGLRYLARALDGPGTVALVVVGAFAGTVIWRRPTVLGVLLATASLTQVAFVVAAGGDWMEGGRFLVPALPLVAVLAAHAVVAIPDRRASRLVGLALVALQVVGLVAFARTESHGRPLWSTAGGDARLPPAGERFGWFERAKPVHRRDGVVVPRLLRVVDDLRPHVDGPVTVASSQAGLITYHLSRERFGDIRFVDRLSLATREFEPCEGATETTSYGRAISYRYWFEHAVACRVPVPDVVFDLGSWADLDDLHGRFSPVLEVRGTITTGSSILPGADVDAAQTVAVRRDLLRHVEVAA